MSTASPIKTNEQVRLNPIVFFGSTALILVLTAALILYPDSAGALLGRIQAWLSHSFGWYYMLAIGAYLFFVVWIAFSRFGTLKLGEDHEKPDFSYGAWAGMLFSSGIGISLLYFAASEPIDHLYHPPEGVPGSPQAARQALQLTFLHWGLHGWAIYALVGLAVGYFAYRHRQPLALRSALYPILGERWVKGAAGHAVDCFGIFVTLLGLVTNLGIGALQVSSGLEYLTGIPHSKGTLLAVILVMSLVATLAAVSGIEKGIRRLSNLNIVLFSSLLVFVLVCGSTLELLNGFVQNLGDYLDGLVLKTFDLYVYTGAGAGKSEEWLGLWTLFYWAWWISWAPFVGMFIARISRGRSVRELVCGVLLIPLGFTLAWLSVFGNSALDLVMNHGATDLGKAALEQPSMSIYLLLEHYPLSKIVIGLSIFVGFVLFLTPADSGSVMLANLSRSGGELDEDAPNWLRILWSAVVTLVTIGLLFAGNFTAMQTVVVLAGLPFSAVLILFMFGLHKAMRADYEAQVGDRRTYQPVPAPTQPQT
ncbi:choline transporter BetT [Pseudomonas paraeruginosa PA7]|uniref:Choline transporter BetT n=1 Tax=Pseudomonas paraeruginosa (strain DSM 24068 / PA7) TaxID=381754 RepID=A6VEI6_PSEP7|nr:MULTISPECIES: BCCT family transporter [Pseudomonas aeruginosa group]ABR84546.1 choline transporter BetT [Pseudomonas aeruginosa PA7]